MSPRSPGAVDVAIVGSGPCGVAYARILSEQCPAAAVATFEVGPLLADPPGVHVKNLADPDEQARAQRRSEGPASQGGDTTAGSPASYRRRDVGVLAELAKLAYGRPVRRRQRGHPDPDRLQPDPHLRRTRRRRGPRHRRPATAERN